MLKYRINEEFDRVGAYQSAIEPVFQFDEKNQCLVEIGKINLADKTNSNLSSSLKVILDKYLNTGILDLPSIDDSACYSLDLEDFKQYDLYELSQVVNKANEYREKFNLPDTASVYEVFDYVDKANTTLSDKLQNGVIKKKEVSEDETQSLNKTQKQEGLQDEGEQN